MVCGDAHLKLEYIRLGWNALKELGALPASADLNQSVALELYLASAIAWKRGLNPARHDNNSAFGDPLLNGLP